MKTEIMKRKMYSLAFGSFLVFLSGCGGSFQTAGYISQGRQALFRGDYQSALSLFQSAAQTDPSFIYGSELREGTLSFLGRAQYLNGELAQARDTLQKALAEHKSDNVARLYLGLTLARLGDRQSGLQQIEAGLKGIRDFLNYITTNLLAGVWTILGSEPDHSQRDRERSGDDLRRKLRLANADYRWRKNRHANRRRSG